MKRHLILTLIVLALVSSGGAQQQNLLNEKMIDNFAILVAATATENTDENSFPELTFEDFDFEKSIHSGSNVIPQTLQNATRIVFNKELVKFSDGTNEFVIQIDLNESYEDVSSDGHYSWTFVVKDNADLLRVNDIYIETSYPVEAMEEMEPFMGAEHAPLKITVNDIGMYYPKRFKQWKAIRRKMLPSFPTDEEYYDNMEWANTDHNLEALEE